MRGNTISTDHLKQKSYGVFENVSDVAGQQRTGIGIVALDDHGQDIDDQQRQRLLRRAQRRETCNTNVCPFAVISNRP